MAETIGARWDLSAFFSEVGGEEQKRYTAELEQDLELLRQYLEVHQDAPLSQEMWVDTILRLEELAVRLEHLAAYAECAHADNVNNEASQLLLGQVGELDALCTQIQVSLLAKLRALSAEEFAALQADPRLNNIAYCLERWLHEARFSMEPELEKLQVELSVPGYMAWERLYENVSGRLEFDYSNTAGEIMHTSMNAKVSLLESADPEVRRTALANSNCAFATVGETMAACLNSIAGYRLKVLDRRGVAHHLDNAAFEAGLSRRTLTVMHEVAAQYRDVLRSYLQLKAELLQLPRLGFQDLFAPVALGTQAKTYAWDEGIETILAAYRNFAPEFADFGKMVLESRWVDAEDRVGKLPGGFCTSTPLIGESRILITYRGSYGDVATLAHEIGHAWHEWLMRDIRKFARQYPMTLAETASTFAERLLGDYLLNQPDAQNMRERITMLVRRLDDSAMYLLNIPMRFEFEDKFYRERRNGEVPLRRLKELMVETQRDIYGEALDPDQLDPWFWASKGHFYITGLSFYNFPYTFGYLFSLGVYARAQKVGPSFLPTYKELLRRTGSDSCEGVARSVLGVDLEQPGFWQESLRLVENDWRELQDLVARIKAK